jgi:hypothetical protein
VLSVAARGRARSAGLAPLQSGGHALCFYCARAQFPDQPWECGTGMYLASRALRRRFRSCNFAHGSMKADESGAGLVLLMMQRGWEVEGEQHDVLARRA